jgi:COMPASS component SWD2
MDFSPKGETLVTAGDDERVNVYSTQSGALDRRLNAKKYGVDLVRYNFLFFKFIYIIFILFYFCFYFIYFWFRFTHASESIICASNNTWDHTIRYWDLYSNKYVRFVCIFFHFFLLFVELHSSLFFVFFSCIFRYFKGHRDKVISLEVNPVSDLFLSSSDDGTVRLWDLKDQTCQVKILLLHLILTFCFSFSIAFFPFFLYKKGFIKANRKKFRCF